MMSEVTCNGRKKTVGGTYMGIVTVGVSVSCKLGLVTKLSVFNKPRAERYFELCICQGLGLQDISGLGYRLSWCKTFGGA